MSLSNFLLFLMKLAFLEIGEDNHQFTTMKTTNITSESEN